MTQPEKIDLIFAGVARYFGVPEGNLRSRSRDKSTTLTPKIFLLYLLKENTTLTLGAIAGLLGYKTSQNIGYHYDNIKEDLREDSYGDPKLKRIFKELKEYIPL